MDLETRLMLRYSNLSMRRDAGDVFIIIEMCLFALLGLLMPLGVILFTAPGNFMGKLVSIVLLGLPYLATIYAPYVTWFWLSAASIVGLFFLSETDLSIGARVVAGLGVILGFLIVDGIVAYFCLSLLA